MFKTQITLDSCPFDCAQGRLCAEMTVLDRFLDCARNDNIIDSFEFAQDKY